MPPRKYWKTFTTLLTAFIATILGFSSSRILSNQVKATPGQTIDDRIARVREVLKHSLEETSVHPFTELTKRGDLKDEKHLILSEKQATPKPSPSWDNWSNGG